MRKNIMHNNHYRFATAMSIAVASLFPFLANAELWELTPRVTLEGRYDDNIRLTSAPHDTVTGALLKGNLEFSRLTEISKVSGRINAKYSDYSDDDEVNTNNTDVDFVLASYYKTERSRWGLDGYYRRDTTLKRIELDDVVDDGLGDDIDEGLVDVNIRRNNVLLTPSWEHSLSERTNLRFALNYRDVSYDKNRSGSGLFDYEQQGVSFGVFRRLSERDTFNISVGASQFESLDNANNEVDGYNLTVGYRRLFSETMSGSINAGINRNTQKSDVIASDVDIDGYVLRLDLKSKTETTKYGLSIKHDVDPSGTGSVVESNQLKFDLHHRFTRRLSSSLLFRFIDNENVGSSNTKETRYYIIRPRMSWKLTRWWTLNGGYDYTFVERGKNANEVDSNAVSISLTHSKPINLE